MSKNTNISELINYISVDGSGNVILSSGQLVATQSYVSTAITNLVNSAPSTLDTLNELASALGNDANFATTVATSIGTKQAQLNGTGFVKISGTTISYDNSTYLTTATASSTYLTTTTAGTTYVPYTGGTANVNLGVYDLDGGNININGGGSGGGALRLKQFAGSEGNREGYSTISTLTSGVFYFTSSASVPNFKNFALNPSGLADNTLRTYTLPDASGTLALTSNIPTLSSLGGVSGSGTQNTLAMWNNVNGTNIGNSIISQPDGNNVRINFGDQFTLGTKTTYVSTYVSKFSIGRTNTGADSNVEFIYDIANTEIFEIRRNYSANTFKVTLNNGLSIVDHLTMSSSGATTFVDNITITNGARPYFIAKTTNAGEEAGIKIQQSTVSDWYIGTAQATPSASDLGIRDVKNGRVPLYFSASTGASIFGSTIQTTGIGIGGANGGTQLIYGTMSTTNTILELNNTNASGYGGYIRAALGSTQYILRLVDQAGNNRFSFYGDGTSSFSSLIDGTIIRLSSTQPLAFTGGGNTGTYTQSAIYCNQTNTSGDTANGIFIERGRLTDSGAGEVRHFIIGARGGSIQWKCDSIGYTTQNGACEVKPSADADLFVGRFSAGSAKLFRVYQLGSDGYLELATGAGDIVTKLSGYGGVSNYTTTNFGFGKSSGISYKIDAYNNGGQVARFTTNQSGANVGQCAEFINSSGSGYASWIYIGSAPGTDWKIGKNISNSANTTYHFEIVDSSNNLRMQINNGTGNVTFSGTVTQNSDIRLKKNIRSIENPLSKILQTRGVLYDRVDESDTNELGFIAQELELVLPELVSTSDLGIKSIKYQNIVAVLVEAMKELKSENNLLKDRLDKNNIN
jgi:hypothetical protein